MFVLWDKIWLQISVPPSQKMSYVLHMRMSSIVTVCMQSYMYIFSCQNPWHFFIRLSVSLAVINECALGIDNCDQNCVDTPNSYTCTCNAGYVLASDGRSCNLICGGRLTATSGSFQTPGWPNNYPQENFQCEWTIELPSSAGSITFTIDDSAFGINGRAPCTNDHIQLFDGTTSNANSLLKLCGHANAYNFEPITTTSTRARVVFTGSVNPSRSASRVGVKVEYTSGGNFNSLIMISHYN